ncbi:hypothetical protein J6590_100377, partial [Homalodisca vitripennis]
MWSVLLAVSLGMLLLEVIPSSQQQLFDDVVEPRTYVPPYRPQRDAAGSVDFATGSVNLAAKSVDFAADSVYLAARSVDLAAGSVDLATRYVNLAARLVHLEAALVEMEIDASVKRHPGHRCGSPKC